MHIFLLHDKKENVRIKMLVKFMQGENMDENLDSNILDSKVPKLLIDLLEKQYGIEITKKILKGYKVKRKVTLRVNTLKSTVEKVKEELTKVNIDFDEAPISRHEALIIKNAQEKEISNLEIYKNGEIYLQSLSSMLPPIVLEPKAGENILDMTAAPGSKTTQIAALSNNSSHITACEMNHIRAEKLKYNIEKQAVTCAYVMLADARKLDDMFSFDKILLDAPCSGSGTIDESDKNLYKTFTLKLINKSVETQLALLRKAIKLLKPGCEMIYSTCSILNCENEDIIEKALKGTKAEVVPINLKSNVQNGPTLLPVKIPGTLCVCPDELFEGFFIAKIKK